MHCGGCRLDQHSEDSRHEVAERLNETTLDLIVFQGCRDGNVRQIIDAVNQKTEENKSDKMRGKERRLGLDSWPGGL